ncbi:MAG: malto-oligosyltrehalose trehalohydrolase [Chloroflexaceae bacterium]|nr:malto-oligosyltrehalose trehalohydrolase [Chloroflexaceae bacterium]
MSTTAWTMPIGALPDAHGTRFRVWAANAQQTVAVLLYEGTNVVATHQLSPEGNGYFSAYIAGIRPGTRYMYRIDEHDPRPDPASRAQPDSVHGPSSVVDLAAFHWTDQHWHGLPLEDLIIYELHVGTFTPAGTFGAIMARLDYLRGLGVTAIELMPVADFPGDRNWGYDGVNLFAPARTYGGAVALQRLVNAAHERGMAVLLDVVYNHLGPDGNYLRQFSESYFTSRHHTPWGEALNVDGDDSRPVRDYFIANACSWAHEYHIDGLRLDATHAIIDDSPKHLLQEMTEHLHATLPNERHFVLIAENEHNDPRIIRRISENGYGLDGQWADDFHHQVRVALTGQREGYFADYDGSAADLAATIQQGWFYTGQYAPSMDKPRGKPADDVPLPRFVYCIQNHDQIGNRAFGERLSHDLNPAAYRAASVLLLCCPETPLLFMGQEWAASTPFLFFTDHNPELGRLVTEGRRAEFAYFEAFAGAQVPDPQAHATFARSKLRWQEVSQPFHNGVLNMYRQLITLRKQVPALRETARETVTVTPLAEHTLLLRRTTGNPANMVLILAHLGKAGVTLDAAKHPVVSSLATMHLLLDSEAVAFAGTGAPIDRAGLTLEGPRALVFGATARPNKLTTH